MQRLETTRQSRVIPLHSVRFGVRNSKEASVNHYPHHIGDYAKDTMGLSQGEHGAYRLLMDASYAIEDGIPEDEVYAVSKAHSPAEKKNTARVLSKYFELKDGRYFQKRIQEEIQNYRDKSVKASQSAIQRWDKRNANAMRTHSEGNADGMLTNNQEPITKKNQRAKRPLPDGFGVSPAVRAWATEHGFGRLEEHLAWFLDYARANGKTYADWDAAFRNCISGNWAKLQTAPRQAADPPWKGAI